MIRRHLTWSGSVAVTAVGVAAGLAVSPDPARAQNPEVVRSDRVTVGTADPTIGSPRPRVLVTGLAGSTIYLSLEDPAFGPVSAGSAIEIAVARQGPAMGRLRVLERVGRRLLTEFESEPFVITRGDVIYLLPAEGVEMRAEATGSGDPSAARSPPRIPPSRGSDRVSGPRMSGLLSLESDLRRSSSYFTGRRDGTIDRGFATPGARVRATLSGLPAGTELHTSLRGYRRDRDSRRVLEESRVQVFEAYASASPRGTPVTLRGGRFLNRHEAFTGYWDGGLLRVGTRQLGVGAAVGWEPAVREERLKRDLFKIGVFAGLETGSRGTRYRLAISAVRSDPSRASMPGAAPVATPPLPSARTVLGASQRLVVGSLRLNADLEAERDPAGSGWGFSRAHFGASVAAGRLTLRGNASRLRGPLGVAFDPTLDPSRAGPRLGPARDRVGAGASLRVGRGSVGGDLTIGRDRLERRSRTLSGHIVLPRTLPADVGLRLNGFHWRDERTNTVWSGFGAVSRDFGRVRAEIGYRVDRSSRSGFGVLSHGLQIGLSVRGSNGWSYAMDGLARRGDDLHTDRLYTRLSKSF